MIRGRSHRHAQGFSLVVVLVLLVVLSILGIAVMRSSAMQERMSGNLRDRALAMQAAEAAVVFARGQLALTPAIDNPGNQDWSTLIPSANHCAGIGICPAGSSAPATWRTGPVLGASDATVPDTPTQYWIEYLGTGQPELDSCIIIKGSSPPPTCFAPMFRITARSRANGRAEVILQSNVIFKLQTL
jgi:type IV pilus assembly protein PilX